MSKKAVLVGCNYPGTDSQWVELRGCINDVWRIYHCLINRCGFSKEDINVLIDTDPSYPQPTGKNIRSELSSLCGSAKPGQWLFFHFSGHGYRIPSENSDDDTGFDECILATDFNPITDDDFKAYIATVPIGCKMTIVADSCHSGGLIEGAKEQIGDSTKIRRQLSRSVLHSMPLIEPNANIYYLKERTLPVSTLIDIFKAKSGRDDIHEGNLRSAVVDIFGEDASPKFMKGALSTPHADAGRKTESGGKDGALEMVGIQMPKMDAGSAKPKSSVTDRGILFSACQTYQGAAEASLTGNPAEIFGVFTSAMLTIIEETGTRLTNRKLVLKAWEKLERQFLTQKPGLYCCDRHADAPFMCAALIQTKKGKVITVAALVILFFIILGQLMWR